MNNFWKDLGFKTKQFLQFVLAFATILFILFLIPKVNSFKYSYETGTPWQFDDLYSPFDFAILKAPGDFEKSKEEVVANHLRHYTKEDFDKQSISKFEKLFNARIVQLDSVHEIKLNSNNVLEKGKTSLQKIYTKGVIKKENADDIVLVENNVAQRKSLEDFFDIATAKEAIANEDFGSEAQNDFLKTLLKMSVLENIVYNQKLNDNLLNNKLAEVSSTNGLVRKGEKIIEKGEIVDKVNEQKLISFEKKYSEQVLDKSESNNLAIGYFLLISIFIVILTLYLFLYQKNIFVRFRRVALIFLLINITIFLTAIFTKTNDIFIYLIPFTIVPIVLRAFFQRETALYVHLTVVFLSALFVPQAFNFIFLQTVAGIAAIYGNKDVRYWSQFFKAIALIFVAYVVSFVGLSLISGSGFKDIEYPIIGFLALNVFFSFLAYPLIVFFEKIFGLLSDISLVEYTDLNKPLLKRMSLEAPGTFQHSLQVANLAEAAASEIGANSLLVKVGALYHDIGKMLHRIYFIENQFPEENPHEKLSFEESAKIIIAHVTDGVKLAKKNGLPEQIIEFIKTHHGTTRVEYFYRMHAKVHKDEVIDDHSFVYPGPAPFKKEHAILMMADSVEAASKSLKNPTHESLNNLVDKIISYQQDRGQFNHVPITLLEISRCKEVFKKMLASIYHIRIEYPKE